jgi:maltose alpha-D-glucosyltransferase/alpha-amylase
MYPGSSEYLEQWVEPWYNTVSHRFLQAYLKASDDAHFIPEERSQIETLIRLFVIEKAVYEADYEINNRPDWINIPLNGLRIILDDLVSE